MVRRGKTHQLPGTKERGQALIEYALILALVVMAMVAAIAATGPALGNLFSNTVYNLIGFTGTPQDLYARGGPTAFWLTVTAVATNPPQGRTFPTSPPRPPTATPTAGPSPTNTPVTPSPTPSFTPTLPPTATPQDFGFNAPFVDPIDEPSWWRVDSSVYLGGDDWYGEYFANRTLSGTPARTLWNQELGPEAQFNINFNWGNNSPIEGWVTDNFSVRWTRQIYVFGTQPLTVQFNLDNDDGARLRLDGTTIINDWSDQGMGSIQSVTQSLSPGAHTLVLEYYEATGGAGVILEIAAYKANTLGDTSLNTSGQPVATPAPNCQWTRIQGSRANTLAWAWRESTGVSSRGFPANTRCHLELRGYVDVSSLTNPVMSFWDVWDLESGSNTTVRLQIAEYQPYTYTGGVLGGGPNWAAGTTITLHNGGKNYAWTRNEIAIPTVSSRLISYRYIIDSGSDPNRNRRWYLDDIRIEDANTRTFTVCTSNKYACGSFWSLDNTDQKRDFLTSGQWDLTTRNAASNDTPGIPSMSWDTGSLTSNSYTNFSSDQGTDTSATSKDFRVHFVEFNGRIDLRGYASGGGLPDWEGDRGNPMLSFNFAYNLAAGEVVEVQYTNDADTVDGTEAAWSTLTTLVPLTSGSTSNDMERREVDLTTVPNYNTATFRLRFALKVNRSTQAAGFWIDNIAIERVGVPRFSNYPFCDDAENGTAQWLPSGQWGVSITSGAFGTGRSFADSPLGNYVHGQTTSLSQRYPFDFNNDTPENFQTPNSGNKDCSGNNSTAATRPILTFFHWRRVAANESFHVDIYRSARGTTTAINPTPIWSLGYSSYWRNQFAWERVELDLRAAIEQVTGQTWTQITTNSDRYDDDFYIAFRFDATSDTSTSDGVYIDNINVRDYNETSFKLWSTTRSIVPVTGAPPAGSGNGTVYTDDFETDWWNRWTTGGNWFGTNISLRSGAVAMHDSPPAGTSYVHDTYSVLEMNQIIDLRGTLRTDNPTLYFWNRYRLGNGDEISVEVAAQDQNEMVRTPPTRNRQGFQYLYNWGSDFSYNNSSSSWEEIWYSVGRVDTWVREQINLSPYADDPTTPSVNEGKRLRIRFVLNALEDSSVSDGWFIDDLRIEFRNPRVYTVPFIDQAKNTQNWITEGSWGLAPDFWRGSGGGTADLGPGTWDVFWFDCIDWTRQPTATFQSSFLNQAWCSENNVNTFFSAIARTTAATQAYLTARPQWTQPAQYIRDTAAEINFDFGSTDRPFGAPTNSTGSSWDDSYMARMMRSITVTGGEYTFISTSDDGVRVRYDGPSSGWAINNWTYHSRSIDLGTVTLSPGTYQITLEWFEGGGDAVVALQVGTNNFSFSDSPKAGASSSFPRVTSTAYGNSSLMLNGVINLNVPTGLSPSLWVPRLNYYTLYWLDNNNQAAVEVSDDGGFNWIQDNLWNNCPGFVWPDGPWCDPNIWGYAFWLPIVVSGETPQNWQLRSHDLRTYANRNLGIRFRLYTESSVRDGWWITDITINN